MTEYTSFLKSGQFALMEKLTSTTTPRWGIMSAQHMVEHICSLYIFTLEKTKIQAFYSPDKLQRNYDYLILHKQPFRKNVKLPGLEKPLPLRQPDLKTSIETLQQLVHGFYAYFEQFPTQKTLHPAVGLLSFEEWEWIHYAHCHHHLYQFGLTEDTRFTKMD